MIDKAELTVSQIKAARGGVLAPAALGRASVLLAGFICAACGLVYELELLAFAGDTTGDSVTHTSVVLSVMVFAMGVGSLLTKGWIARASVGFALVEALLALVGGLSSLALHAGFAPFGQPTQPALVGFSFVIGVLMGAELPLLMTLIQRVRRQEVGDAAADLLAADYVGALVGGLAFPFLLLPAFGQLRGAMVAGALNAIAGAALVGFLFRHDLTRRALLWLGVVNVAVLATLGTAAITCGPDQPAAPTSVPGDNCHAGSAAQMLPR